MAAAIARANAVLLLLSLATALLSSPAAAATLAAAEHGKHVIGWVPGGSECRGTIAECLAGEEWELGSESTRRILSVSSRYISYGALKRDTTPCSRRGQSYYNCRPAARANPYTRGCSRITQCRQ